VHHRRRPTRYVVSANAIYRARSPGQDRYVATKNPVPENAPLRNYTLKILLNATIISRHRTARIGNAARRGACRFGR